MRNIISNTALGLEINDHRVLLAELRHKGGAYHLQKIVQAAIPLGVMAEGKIQQVDTLVNVIRQAMQDADIRTRKAHLVVPSQFVVIRHLQLPDLPRVKLRKVIDFELKNSIHLPFEDPVYDFVKTGEVPQSSEGAEGAAETLTEVALIAASASVIDPMVQVAKGVGLKPLSVDVRALALSRTCLKLCPRFERQTTMFVDVAENWTDIHIFDGASLKFTRNVPMELDSYRLDRNRSKPLHVLDILEYFETNTDYRSFTNDLAYEIERSMNFYRYTLHNREANLSTIILSGLLPKSGVLQAYLQERFLQISTMRMPLEELRWSKQVEHLQDIAHEYAIPIGLALKEVK